MKSKIECASNNASIDARVTLSNAMLTLPRPMSVDAETLAATTLTACVRITKTKAVTESLLNEVYLGTLKYR